MKNIHIELVKKWLADNNSVSRDELVANDYAAHAAYDASAAAYAYVAASDADAAAYVAASDAAAYAYVAASAADAAAYGVAPDASYWVKRYEELTK